MSIHTIKVLGSLEATIQDMALQVTENNPIQVKRWFFLIF